MKARLLLGLCALLAFPACFDPIVGAQCAKGYSRCGNKCVVSGTCTLPDAGNGAADQDADQADALLDGPDTIDAPVSDGSDDLESQVDAEVADVALPPETDSGTPGLDEVGPETTDGDVDSGLPTEDAPPTSGMDAETFDTAIDVPQSSPDAEFDTWVARDLVPLADISNDDGLNCPDCDAGVDAASLEAGGLAVDADDAGDASEDDLGPAESDADDGDAQADSEPDALVVDTGPLVCEDNLTNCGEQCVDLANDPENCGSCVNICTSGVCNSGTCLVCASNETVCERSCVNTASNPDHCGSCLNPCPSGLCSDGDCEEAGTGRVIVIGHDYSFSRPIKNRLLGNAVFLWPANPVRLLRYTGDATDQSIAGADAAIDQVAGASRSVSKTTASSTEVPELLPSADVFLVYAQATASDTTLSQLGADWSAALATFLGRGGTVIVLDADQAANAGTVQILATAGLLNLTRQASASAEGTECNVVALGDALAAGMYRRYSCQANSTTFTLGESGTSATSVVETVLGDAASAPVVVRKIF